MIHFCVPTHQLRPSALAEMIYSPITGAAAVCSGPKTVRRIKAENVPSDTVAVAGVLSWQAPRSSITFNCDGYCCRTRRERATQTVYRWARPAHISPKVYNIQRHFPLLSCFIWNDRERSRWGNLTGLR